MWYILYEYLREFGRIGEPYEADPSSLHLYLLQRGKHHVPRRADPQFVVHLLVVVAWDDQHDLPTDRKALMGGRVN